MPRLIHTASGSTVNFEGEDYQQAVASGAYSLLPGEGVEVTIGGSPATVPLEASELDPRNAARSSVGTLGVGTRRAAEEEAFREAAFGSFGQEVLTGVEGILGGATFGGYTALADALGADIGERAETNPYISAGTNIAGSVVPGLFTGGTGTAASVARAIPSGALIARTGALAKSVGGFRGLAAATALEGAAFGAGQAINNIGLSDVPFTAEAAISEIGLNTVFGVGAGVLGGALAHGAGRVASKLENMTISRTGKNAAESALFDDVASSTRRGTSNLNQVSDDVFDTAARVSQGSTITGSPNQLKQWAAQRHQLLTDEANNLVVAARQANLGEQRLAELNAALGKSSKLSRTILNPGSRVDSKTFGTVQSGLNGLEKQVRRVATTLDGKVGGSHWQAVATKLDDLDNGWHRRTGSGQVAPRLGYKDGQVPTGTVRQSDPALKELLEEAEESRQAFREAWGLNKSDVISPTAFRRFANMDPQQAMEAASTWSAYQRNLQKLASKLPDPDLGAGISGSVDQVSKSIQSVIPAGSSTSAATELLTSIGYLGAAGAIPEMDGPADEMLKLYLAGKGLKGGAGLVPGAKGRLANLFAGAAGAKAGGMVSRAIGGGGGFVLRAQGAQLARQALRGGGQLANAAGSALERIETATAKILRGVEKATRRATAPTALQVLSAARFGDSEEKTDSKAGLRGAFQARSRELVGVMANPLAAHQRIYDSLTPLRAGHPLVADKAEMKLMEGANFIYDKMPKDPGNMQSFGQSRWVPDEQSIVRWANYVKAVQDPIGVLEDAADGSISPQGAEVLRTVYPELFSKAQLALARGVAELQENTTFDQRGRLSILFGVPVDSAYGPEMIEFNKQFWADRMENQPPLDPDKFAPNTPSDGQQLASK